MFEIGDDAEISKELDDLMKKDQDQVDKEFEEIQKKLNEL